MATNSAGRDSEAREAVRLARACSRCLRLLPGPQKNACLQAFGTALIEGGESVLKAAHDDAAHARAHGAPTGVVQAIALGRTDLESKARLAATLAGLPEPIGRIESTWIRPNGLKIEKTRVPLGVVAVLAEYEVRAVIDAILLCAKAGDAVVLGAGPMICRTCRAIARAMGAAALPAQVPIGPLYLIPGHDAEARRALVTQREGVDVVIPVGSPAWVETIGMVSCVPVLGQTSRRHHVYVDEDADPAMAVAVAVDIAPGDPYGEGPNTVLVHRAAAGRLLPAIAAALLEKTVPFSADPGAARILQDVHAAGVGTTGDAGVGVHLELVDGVDSAASVIASHGPGFSDGIITNDRAVAARFAALVDSACVYLNASTRFTDGGQFGMGAQVTVSTGRLHARGPLGIDELTTYKYLVTGKGQTLG